MSNMVNTPYNVGHASLSPCAGMGDVVNFTIYYGSGEVKLNEYGSVDMSGFSHYEVAIPAPERRSIGWVHEWMRGTFGTDPETYDVSVQVLEWKGIWVMKSVNRSKEWKHWVRDTLMQNAPLYMFVQFTYKEMSAALALGDLQVEDESPGGGREEVGAIAEPEVGDVGGAMDVLGDYISGQADEGEVREEIVHGMERDDQLALTEEAEIEDGEDEEGEDEESDSGEEEDESNDPVPAAWKHDFREQFSGQTGGTQPWEYRQNEVVEGAMYRNKEAVKKAVDLWGMSTQREFRTKTTSREQYHVVCVEPDCDGSVHASIGKYEVQWVIRRVVQHGCMRDGVLGQHRNLTSSLIASLFYREIVENVTIQTKFIQSAVRSQYQYRISYHKAWRAKQKALEMRFGTFLDSYHNLPSLLQTLKERNHGTYVDIVALDDETFAPGQKVLLRAFFAFGACIRAFPYCRPVLCVDGTFLTGKFRGQILTAIGVDGNNQLVPIAMAFVEGENYDSWLWFFQQLKLGVVMDRPNVCLIHDRHPGILKAVKQLRTSSFNHDDPIV